MRIPFNNTYAQLPGRFYFKQEASKVPAPEVIRINTSLAKELSLEPNELKSAEGLAFLSGNTIPEGAEPLAQAYAGHQFGNFSPQLGDGRALLIGELLDQSGKRFDLQLKGSGPTPFSRSGDGRSALGPVLREYFREKPSVDPGGFFFLGFAGYFRCLRKCAAALLMPWSNRNIRGRSSPGHRRE